MPRFIAIPVGQGDAFYLERENFSVLVDGGRNRSGFATMFQNVTNTDGVNVAICTHNDADHANGILGFLEAGFRCEEIWLPGRWLSALPDVLKPFVEVFIELARDIEQAKTTNRDEQDLEFSPIEAYADSLRENLNDVSTSDARTPIGEDGWPNSFIHMLERGERWEDTARLWLWPPGNWPPFSYHHYQRLESTGVQLLWSAIDAARRIRDITLEAFHRGIPVRWFEFATTTPSGGIAALQPVNARAVARVRPRIGPLLSLLSLTVSNKESLVFWSPSAEAPGSSLSCRFRPLRNEPSAAAFRCHSNSTAPRIGGKREFICGGGKDSATGLVNHHVGP